MKMKGVAGIGLVIVVILDVAAMMIIGFGTYQIPAFNNGTVTPIPPPTPSGFCGEGYNSYVNITLDVVRLGEVLIVPHQAAGITNTAMGMELNCTNSTGYPLPYQTAVKAMWYENGIGVNVTATHQNTNVTFILINNTNVISDNIIVCQYDNTTEKTDRSESIALWLDDFENYATGTMPFRATSTVSDALGGVCATNGQQAAGCGVTGGQTTTWNVTQYRDITVIWETNNTKSAANDQQFNEFGTGGSTYRCPYNNAGNNWVCNYGGGAAIGNQISYTGINNIGGNITFRSTSTLLEFAINGTLWGGNASDVNRVTHSQMAWSPGIALKGLLSLQVYNRSITPYQAPNNLSYATGSC